MEHLEGRLSVLAALRARKRSFQVILIAHGAHEEKVREVIDLAAANGVAVKFVDRRELDAMAHGATHGGGLAVVSPPPRAPPAQLSELIAKTKQPPPLLLPGGSCDTAH